MFCTDKEECQMAKARYKNQQSVKARREKRAARPSIKPARYIKKPPSHIQQVDAFIPEAERHADEHVQGCCQGSTDARKAEWDAAYHGEMDRLTVEAGLRVLSFT